MKSIAQKTNGKTVDPLPRADLKAIAKRVEDVGLIVTLSDAIRDTDHFAKDAGGRLFCYTNGVYRPKGEDLVLQRVADLTALWNRETSWSRRLNREVVEHVRVASPQLWERPPLDRLNVLNGLLNLKTGKLRRHTPDYLSPVQIPVTCDPDARCPRWRKFGKDVFPRDARDVCFQLPAWLMTPDTAHQGAVLLVGEGANGKSIYLTGLRRFIGKDNCSAVSLHKIAHDRFASAQLQGKLANICADLPDEHLADTSTFKMVTGGDAISAEYKFRDSFSFVPFARLVFSANNYPRSRDSSEGYFRRWLVVPFEKTFTPDSPGYIPGDELEEMLTEPEELSGLLNYALSEFDVIQGFGLTESPSMERARNEMRQLTDPFAVWLAEETEMKPDAATSKAKLIEAYGRYCRANDLPKISPQTFGRRLKKSCRVEEGQRCVGIKRVWCYVGIALRKREEKK